MELMYYFKDQTNFTKVYIQRLLTLDLNRSCVGVYLMEPRTRVRLSGVWMTPLLKFEDKIEIRPNNEESAQAIWDAFFERYGHAISKEEEIVMRHYFLTSVNTHSRDYPFELLSQGIRKP